MSLMAHMVKDHAEGIFMNVTKVSETLQGKIASATSIFPMSLLSIAGPNWQKGVAVFMVLGVCLVASRVAPYEATA